MAGETKSGSDPASPAWFIVRRWREYEGEIRVCVLRIGMVLAFYGAQLIHFLYWSQRSESDLIFHRQATGLAAIGLLVSLTVLAALMRGFFPSWLKFASTSCDFMLVTGLALCGSGPSSPIVYLYFPLLLMTGLRFSFRLIWFGVLLGMLGYMGLVGRADPVWFDGDHTTKPIQQIVMLLSLGSCGLISHQWLLAVYRFAEAFDRTGSKPSSEAL